MTASERELNFYASNSFLKLWTYSNLFIDKRSNGAKTHGKELCDALVVCGDHVIIFSDKAIDWQFGQDDKVAWSRWRRRAIDKSVDQVRGAARWLQQYPERIFTDAACTVRFPIPLPPVERLKLHGIVVARGAGKACRRFFGTGSESLIITSAKWDAATTGTKGSPSIFCVGDVNPDGFYFHVLDDVSLNVVLQELDTISDFVWYLEDKAEFMRSDRMICAHGEEELLTAHLRGMDETQRRHKIAAGIPKADDHQSVIFSEGLYSEFRELPEYNARKSADKMSYVWDGLIEHFTKHILEQTVVELPDMIMNESLADHERALREMALQCRVQRRILSSALKGAFEGIKDQDRFFRLAIVNMPFQQAETGFAFLVFKDNVRSNPSGIYSEYRYARTTTLYGYLMNALRARPDLKRIVGVATDLPKGFGGKAGTSEDILFIEQPDEWTPELLAEANELQEGLEIWSDKTLKETPLSQFEYPDAKKSSYDSSFNPINYNYVDPMTGYNNPGENRAARRARQARERGMGRRRR